MTLRQTMILPWLLLPMALVGRADAHLVSTDLGPFYDGAAHPLVTAEDLLTIFVLACLAGLGGPQRGRRCVLALAGGWALGVFAAFGLGGGEFQLPIVSVLVLMVGGVAVAANVSVPDVMLAVIAALIGLGRGVMNGMAARAADGQWLSVIGIASSVLVLMVIVTGLCVWLAQHKARVALRVAGSWIGAIALLKMGWELQAG